MELTEATDAIREKLLEHRIFRTANLWSTILQQIRKQDAFDGHYADTILEIIRGEAGVAKPVAADRCITADTQILFLMSAF
jgi:hypothetical protein